MANFRLLSLDGGGIKGSFTASVLAQWEAGTNKKIVEHFDLIAGTSTGGIIAIALGLGLSASEILEFYKAKGPQIFPSTGFGARGLSALRHVLRSKYEAEVLRGCLVEVFQNRRFGESRCRLVIPSYDAVSGNVHIFKTAHHEDFRQDFHLTAVDVAMATAAAPTYFPVFRASNGVRHVDGGVWANCPATVGLTEAMTCLGRGVEEVDVLSVGTTESPSHVLRRRRKAGWLVWNRSLVELLMEAQVQGAIAQCAALTGKRLLRISTVTEPGRFSLDDARQLPDLLALGVREGRRTMGDVDRRFLYAPADVFVPFHGSVASR